MAYRFLLIGDFNTTKERIILEYFLDMDYGFVVVVVVLLMPKNEYQKDSNKYQYDRMARQTFYR